VNMPTENDHKPTSRIPPQSVDTERAVLGSMLMEAQAASIALTELKPHDFYRPEHVTIFNEIRKIYDSGKNPDLLLLENSLQATGKLEPIGGMAALVDLTYSVASAADVDFLCEIVKQQSIKRQLIERFTKAIDQAYNPEADFKGLLTSAESFLYSVLTGENTQRMQTMDIIMGETLQEIERIQQADSSIIGLASGLPHDEILSGYQKQKSYVIAARPGMGKSAFMLQHVEAFAQNGSRPGVLSLEMGNRSLGNRLIMADAAVDSKRARTGRLTPDELQRCRESAAKLSKMNIVIDDSTHLTPALLRVKARMMKQQHKIDVLALDYLQLMQADDNQQNREREVAEVSRTCKLISKELDIPVIILAQLSRKPEERRGWGKRPQNGDLRESGAIEQDADVVLMLFRPEEYGLDRYENGESTANICEVIITKHRDGPTGLKKLIFDKNTMQFKKKHPQPAPPVVDYDENINKWWD
jgi:replicative DNA helicase